MSPETDTSLQAVTRALVGGTTGPVEASAAIAGLLAAELPPAQTPDASAPLAAPALPPPGELAAMVHRVIDGMAPHPAQPTPDAEAAQDLVQRFLLGDPRAPSLSRPGDMALQAAALTSRADALVSHSPGPASAQKKAHALSLALLEQVARNTFENTFAHPGLTAAASALHAVARNSLSVMLPAVARGLLSYGVQAGVDRTQASGKTRDAIAATLTLLPVLLIMAGAARDVTAGTAKRSSLLCQLIMVAQTVAAAVIGLRTQTIGKAIAPVVAFTAFGAMRTVGAQSRLTLTDRGAKPEKTPDIIDHAAASVTYALAVFASTLAYATPALRTGAAAFQAGDSVAAAARGATLAGMNNLMQESVDALASPGVPAARDQRVLQLVMEDKGYTAPGAINQLVGAFPMLTVYNTASIVAGTVASQHFPDEPKQAAALLATLYAVYSGVFYTPFVMGLSGQPAGKVTELQETAPPLSAAREPESKKPA